MLVMLGHFEHPLSRDVAAPEDVLEERHHVVRAIGAAERHQDYRIVDALHSEWFPCQRDLAAEMTPRGFEPRLQA